MYVVGDSLMSVPFNSATGELQAARLLFVRSDPPSSRTSSIGVAADRMLMTRVVPRPSARPLTVVLNWHTELLRRMAK